MGHPSPDSQGYEQILAQHADLKDLLDEIEKALAEKVALIEDVCHLLAQLADRLVKHFELEEEGGYFSEALLHAPRLVARANALMRQHPLLCDHASQLADSSRDNWQSEGWWDETSRRFDDFKKALLKHETNENRLLQEAYVRDIGSHD